MTGLGGVHHAFEGDGAVDLRLTEDPLEAEQEKAGDQAGQHSTEEERPANRAAPLRSSQSRWQVHPNR